MKPFASIVALESNNETVILSLLARMRVSHQSTGITQQQSRSIG